MDASALDQISRALATAPTRRSALAGLAGALTALVTRLASGDGTGAAAQPKVCRPVGKPCFPSRGLGCCHGAACQDGVCRCPKRSRRCGKRCLPKRKCCHHSDCPGNQRCRKNRCQCAAGKKRCGKRCIARSACCHDRECGAHEACVRGACACAKGAKPCGEACIPADHCCQDTDCGANGACVQGDCACAGGFESCRGACIPDDSVCCEDADCEANEVCTLGVCACDAGYKPCAATCIPNEGCCENSDCNEDQNCENHICVAKRCGTGGPCRVFVTSSFYFGNLGGIEGADAKCQAAADGSEFTQGGTYKAWISDNQDASAPVNRFTNLATTGPYVRVDGAVVANDWADLTTSKNGDYLRTQISLTEAGAAKTTLAWTNTWVDGNRQSDLSCGNWVSTGNDPGEFGENTYTDDFWTRFTVIECNSRLSLYCFEQG